MGGGLLKEVMEFTLSHPAPIIHQVSSSPSPIQPLTQWGGGGLLVEGGYLMVEWGGGVGQETKGEEARGRSDSKQTHHLFGDFLLS